MYSAVPYRARYTEYCEVYRTKQLWLLLLDGLYSSLLLTIDTSLKQEQAHTLQKHRVLLHCHFVAAFDGHSLLSTQQLESEAGCVVHSVRQLGATLQKWYCSRSLLIRTTALRNQTGSSLIAVMEVVKTNMPITCWIATYHRPQRNCRCATFTWLGNHDLIGHLVGEEDSEPDVLAPCH